MDQRNRDLFRNRSRDTCVDVVTNLTLKEKQGGERERGRGRKKGNAKRQFNRQFLKTCTGFLPPPFFPSGLKKSSIGRKTFWKYEGADGIVFNEVWPELHLPLSRHLGPAAVTSPRAQFKKLAGTSFPDSILLDIFDSSLSLSCFRQCEILNVSRNLYILDEINDKSEKRKKEKGKEQIPCRDSISLDR